MCPLCSGRGGLCASCATKFYPWRLQTGREMRGLTKRALAEACSVLPRVIGLFEAGKRRPTEAEIVSFAVALKLPRRFFSTRPPEHADDFKPLCPKLWGRE